MSAEGQSQSGNSGKQKNGRQRQFVLKKAMSKLPAPSNDNFLLMMLFAMGLSGFAYILTAPLGKDINKSSILDKIFMGEESKSMTSNFIKSNLLKIHGDAIENSPMYFNFQGLAQGYEYEINFGDQCTSTIDKDKMVHVYSKPGTYKIELKKIARGHIYTVHCDYINIQ